MLGRHIRTLESSEDLDEELYDVGIGLLLVRRLGGKNAQNICQCAGDKKPHILVLVLQEPFLA